ncbi:DUF1801 domain-containing protein [Spirosoma montaniterrae]|nr:DUF1801 domain-containing protein [Spirosoma montaniterrae]
MKTLDNFYASLPDATQSCLLALRDLILAQSERLTPAWKWNTPFFDYKGRYLFYLSARHKKLDCPYIGVVNGNEFDHPALTLGNRAQIKIMFINPEEDLPVEQITEVLQLAMAQRDQPNSRT